MYWKQIPERCEKPPLGKQTPGMRKNERHGTRAAAGIRTSRYKLPLPQIEIQNF